VARVTKRWLVSAALCVAVAGAGVLAWTWCEPPLYRVTVLPSPDGGNVWACALNDVGQVTCGITKLGPRLVLWDCQGGMQDLGPVFEGGLFIDNSGRIAGTAVDPNLKGQAFLWEPGKGRTLLNTLGGESIVLAMSNNGQILGTRFKLYAGSLGFFLWEKTVGIREVTPSVGTPRACSINDAGQVIMGRTSSPIPFLLDPNGRVTSLWGLGETGMPRSVNNNSCVVGTSLSRAGPQLVLLSKQGMPRYLPICDKLLSMTRLNDRNQISYTLEFHRSRFQTMWKWFTAKRADNCRSYLWDPERGRVSLSRYVRGMKWFRVWDLNNEGSIVGTATVQDGTTRPILLEPIPERWRR
jgi:hypothetical protein